MLGVKRSASRREIKDKFYEVGVCVGLASFVQAMS